MRRLIPYFTPYRRMLAGGLVLVMVSSAIGAVIPWLLRAGIDSLHRGADWHHVALIAAGIIAVALGGGALRYWMREILNGLSRHIENDLRQALFDHLTTLDADYYGRTRTGDLMARLTNDLSAVRMAAGPAIMYLTNTIFGATFALVFMLRIDVKLTALALIPMIMLPVIMIRTGAAIHRRFEAVQEQFSTLTTQVQENLAGVRVVRAYRQENAEIARFGALNDTYVEKNIALAKLYGMMNPLFGLLAGLSVAIVLGVGGSLVVRGTITVGAFVAFGFYLTSLTWPMIALGWVINLFQRGAASMGRLVEVLDTKASIADAPTPASLPHAERGRAITFRDVSFHYPAPQGAEPRWVLREVSFTVPAGGTLAVVGATASGKSALIDLIPRLHDPQEGQVLIDGVDVRELRVEELRDEIGYVPQESFLFSDTIASNLAYGDASHALVDHESSGEATPEQSRTLGAADAAADAWAADVAQLGETIESFPYGYGTMLGERGINLSGGQKQRLALARALARRPRIVLLDDALSAVDTHTEAEILRGLGGALAGRTAVIASHRVSAVRDASWIIVLDGGRIVEQGLHEDLMAAGGRYTALLSRQQLEESIEDESPTGDLVGSQ
ncbi:MAG: ABC transporter ATP-binding protein [Gemmatimonadaceae bacterium]